jgi:hypothetical protein
LAIVQTQLLKKTLSSDGSDTDILGFDNGFSFHSGWISGNQHLNRIIKKFIRARACGKITHEQFRPQTVKQAPLDMGFNFAFVPKF